MRFRSSRVRSLSGRSPLPHPLPLYRPALSGSELHLVFCSFVGTVSFLGCAVSMLFDNPHISLASEALQGDPFSHTPPLPAIVPRSSEASSISCFVLLWTVLHGLALGLCCIDAVRQPSDFPGFRSLAGRSPLLHPSPPSSRALRSATQTRDFGDFARPFAGAGVAKSCSRFSK